MSLMQDTAPTAAKAGIEHIGPKSTDGDNPAIDAVVSRLDAAVAHILEDDDAFKTFLAYKGSMHNYSWLNLMLIYGDFYERGYDGPVCTMGYKGWLTQGRKVKPGSKAISLFKPILKFWRNYNVSSDAPGVKWDKEKQQFYALCKSVQGFEIINKTFHIQDTDGPDYDAPTPIPLEGDDELAWEIKGKLTTTAIELGVSQVGHKEMPEGYGGCYVPGDKSIYLNSNNAVAQQAKTLAHELAHHVSYKLGLEHHDAYQTTRGLAETVVEGAAFVIMASFGIDTTSYSAPYIARWAEDMQLVRRLLRDIDKVSKVVIEQLHPKEA